MVRSHSDLLIAKMGDTYANVSETAQAAWTMEMARIIESMEREMSLEERKDARMKQWITFGSDSTERYMQIQVVDKNFWRTKKRSRSFEKTSNKKTLGWFCVPWI